MRLYLIAPCRKKDIWRKKRVTFTLPPMSLAILASLTPEKIEIKITDELVEDIALSSDPDIVALSVNTTNAKRAYEIAEYFRKKGSKIIMGGIHPSCMPEEALQYADSVVAGEGEPLWQNIISDFQRGRLKAIYKSADFSDMSIVPKPKWELLNNNRYFVPRTFQVSRGCPYGCSFCSSTKFFGRHYRFKPVKNVVDEIKDYPKKFLVFVDDNIVGNHDYARELFKSLMPLKKRWVAQASIDIAKDQRLLQYASDSGCAGLLIGFESIRYSNKKDVKKLRDPQDYAEMIRLIHSYRIGVHGSFVFGFDEDTEDVFTDTIDFVIRNRLECANYCKLTPFPGTELFEKMKSEDRLLTLDWSKYDRYHLVFKPKHIDVNRFYILTDDAYRRTFSFYSILKRMPNIISNIPYYLAINLSYRLGAKSLRNSERGKF
ncbi:MAG: radical SAM protein [Nitrospirae bacterium]|nr:radical SAM protein [Nitrospirota bacterium]